MDSDYSCEDIRSWHPPVYLADIVSNQQAFYVGLLHEMQQHVALPANKNNVANLYRMGLYGRQCHWLAVLDPATHRAAARLDDDLLPVAQRFYRFGYPAHVVQSSTEPNRL